MPQVAENHLRQTLGRVGRLRRDLAGGPPHARRPAGVGVSVHRQRRRLSPVGGRYPNGPVDNQHLEDQTVVGAGGRSVPSARRDRRPVDHGRPRAAGRHGRPASAPPCPRFPPPRVAAARSFRRAGFPKSRESPFRRSGGDRVTHCRRKRSIAQRQQIVVRRASQDRLDYPLDPNRVGSEGKTPAALGGYPEKSREVYGEGAGLAFAAPVSMVRSSLRM